MSSFRFKQFEVEQSDVPMKLGTDGVLVGAWAECGSAASILDIGTGTGVIALMMAQRSTAEHIVGIDIDAAAAECAAANFAASPWSSRLEARQCAVQDFTAEGFDFIISNPPYFTSSLLCDNARKSAARHTVELSFQALSDAVCRLLNPSGSFALILPTEQMALFESITPLKVVRRCNVYSAPGQQPKRVMAQFARSGVEAEVENITIYTAVKGEYSEQYRQMTKDFYLKF